ncbi:methyltransferase domain-containing protein [Streptomyces palmae]|uniref:methyltransferase domain-containing protein n=1 Tax=Streptomyces palmae TaxID=1701085 RepID=UPI001FD76A53|nr:methyltransferase domain-containing protein [Streptomyces palmae]
MSTDPTLADVRPRLGALVDELSTAGAIRTPRWAEVFASVPRHPFVPRWYSQETNDRGLTVWRLHSAAEDRDAWLAAVYSDQTLVTALDPETAEQVDEHAWTGVPTSSGTMPSLLAGMVEELLVHDGHRVWDVGTGTGYLTALLCSRVGADLVYSSDVDPQLVDAARGRLAQLGYEPHLAACDARDGHPGPDDVQFDRTIATCSVPAIPQAWIEQTRPGGLIVTDIALGIEGGLVRVRVDKEHASGAFTITGGRFMAARGNATTYPAKHRAPYASAVDTRRTDVTAADIRAHYPFRLLLAFHFPAAELVYSIDDDTGAMALQLQLPDGTWARTPLSGAQTVTYGGSPGLWQEVEEAWRWWNEQDRPTQDRFCYHRDADGCAHVRHLPTRRRWAL